MCRRSAPAVCACVREDQSYAVLLRSVAPRSVCLGSTLRLGPDSLCCGLLPTAARLPQPHRLPRNSCHGRSSGTCLQSVHLQPWNACPLRMLCNPRYWSPIDISLSLLQTVQMCSLPPQPWSPTPSNRNCTLACPVAMTRSTVMYDVPRRKKLRDRCAEPWKRKGAAVSGFPSLPRLPVRAQGPPYHLEFVVTILLCGKRPEGKRFNLIRCSKCTRSFNPRNPVSSVVTSPPCCVTCRYLRGGTRTWAALRGRISRHYACSCMSCGVVCVLQHTAPAVPENRSVVNCYSLSIFDN